MTVTSYISHTRLIYVPHHSLSFIQGKGQLRTYFVIGEDNDKVKERRMSRLAPPKTTSSLKSPKSSPRHKGERSPKLQKIASLPLLKHQDSIDKDKEIDCGESDKLLNGMIPHSPCPVDMNNDSPSMVSRPGLPRKLDDEWYMLTKNRRSASVKIKFNDEMIPENNVLGDFRRSDTIWENSRKEVEENLANLCTEGSPLLTCAENLDKIAAGSAGNPIKMARRQSAGETRVWKLFVSDRITKVIEVLSLCTSDKKAYFAKYDLMPKQSGRVNFYRYLGKTDG